MFRLIVAAAVSVGLYAQAPTAPTIAATPAALSFNYQIGGATLPAPQTFTLKRTGTGAALDYTITTLGTAPWLIISPVQGKTGGTVSVRVNPTSLLAGTDSVTLQVDAIGALAPVLVTVTLVVKNPPPAMSASPASIAFSYDTDQPADPVPQTVWVASSGEPVSFTVAASGGTWISVDKDTGIAVAGSPVGITATVGTAGLTPGTYPGRITITSANAANKSVVIQVNLTVNAGTAVIQSIWPSAAPMGSDDVTITIRGKHLFKTSVVLAGMATLNTTWVGTTVLLATIPKGSMLAPGTLAVSATNAPKPSSNTVNFTVTPPGPLIQSVVNAASFSNGSATTPALAPGEIISIFGSGLGPSALLPATPTGGAFPTSLGTPPTIVEFELTTGVWTPAPIIFVQTNQVNAVVPFGLASGAGQNMRVTYNSLTSANYTFDGVVADPGLFTIDSSGRGQAAALNYNSTTQTYSINAAGNPVAKGSILVLFLTGGGITTPLPLPDGQVIPLTTPVPRLAGQVSVSIGGDGAPVQSATAVPGSIAGLVQLNISVPSSIKAAKDHSVVVTIGGRSSPATATVSVK